MIPNYLSPWQMIINLLWNSEFILLDFMVLMADFFYADLNSMSFWVGDIFYQIAVL